VGTIYKRKVRFCTTCDRRLDTTAIWHACRTAGHPIEIREQSVWWIKYQLNGHPQCVSSGSTKKQVAKRLLRLREGDVEKGLPIAADVNRITFDDAATDLINDYTTNQRRSLRVLKLRLEKHLTPVFTRRRVMAISTLDIRAYTAKRQAAGASNASVNRDLIILKRMCRLALQAGKLLVQPYIPPLKGSQRPDGVL
jgi:hypothetical protein